MTGKTKWVDVALISTVMAFAMALGAADAAAQDADFEWSGRIDSDHELVVRGVTGHIEARLASGSEARVEAHKTGRSSDFDRIEIVMMEERGAVVFCVVYDGRGGGDCDRNGLDLRGDRRGRSIRAGVDFTVYVPAGVRFSGRTVSGDIVASGLRSDVVVATVSGDVTVSTTGVAEAKTVSGDVNVEMGSLEWRSLDFSTVSGDITVTAPAGVDADVEFSSLSGDFRSDFDLRITRDRGRLVGRRLEATIGSGSRSMSFKTVSGDARLRRASD